MSQVQTVKVYAEIKGFPNYSVAPDGEVFSINRGKPLKWYRGKGCERPHVTLFNNGVSSKLFVATLVAKAFVPNPKPNVYKYVRYKDGNSANNHYTNLEWCRNQTGSKYYYLSVGAESLWDSRELIMKAISEQNKLIKEEYDNNNK